MIRIENTYFKGKRNFSWKKVEKYLKKYVGTEITNLNYKKTIKIDNTCIDEMANSIYTRKLISKMKLVKANCLCYLTELIKEASNERWEKDIEGKHKNKAKNGWNRYDVFFEYPKRNQNTNEIIEYIKYKGTLVVRIDEKNEMYAYDIIDIKK